MTPAKVCLCWQRLHTNLNLSSLAEMFPSLCVNMPDTVSGGRRCRGGALRVLYHAIPCHAPYAVCTLTSLTVRPLPCVLCHASYAIHPLPCVLGNVSSSVASPIISPLPYVLSCLPCHAPSAMHSSQSGADWYKNRRVARMKQMENIVMRLGEGGCNYSNPYDSILCVE